MFIIRFDNTTLSFFFSKFRCWEISSFTAKKASQPLRKFSCLGLSQESRRFGRHPVLLARNGPTFFDTKGTKPAPGGYERRLQRVPDKILLNGKAP